MLNTTLGNACQHLIDVSGGVLGAALGGDRGDLGGALGGVLGGELGVLGGCHGALSVMLTLKCGCGTKLGP